MYKNTNIYLKHPTYNIIYNEVYYLLAMIVKMIEQSIPTLTKYIIHMEQSPGVI